jgi:hypothetical protein
MLEKEMGEKKKWAEPILEKGDSIQKVTFSAGQYGTHDESGCGLLEKIITFGQCK